MFQIHKLTPAAAAIAFGLTASPVSAHFRLLEPENYVEQTEGLFGGDPQKIGPCGPGASESVTETDAITEYHAGEKIQVKWEITVPHSGYYRIALAENASEFTEPPLKDGTCEVDLDAIPKGAHDNILADGFNADESNASATMAEVTLPDEPCEKCILQVIMFMTNHDTPCGYYHCANVKILPKDSTSGTGGTTGSGGATGTGGTAAGSGGMSGGTGGVAASSGGTTGGGSGGKGAAGSGGTTGAAGTSGTATGGAPAMASGSGGVTTVSGSGGASASTDDSEDEGGCAVARPGAGNGGSALLALLGLALGARNLRRRRARA